MSIATTPSVHTPEVTPEQPFYKLIMSMASQVKYVTMLEIGSSTGLGSTRAFIEGISTRADKDEVQLYCLEMFRPAFDELVANSREHGFIRCCNENSIALEEFPEWDDIQYFYLSTRTFLNDYPIETVRTWYDNGTSYARQTGLTHNGIKKIKTANKIKNFDLVLIDGSEFTGEQDLYSVLGAKTIMLDDCMTYKCRQAFNVLTGHSSYKLAFANMEDRHGYAVFNRAY